MAVPPATKVVVVVIGTDGAEVAAEVVARRAAGERVAGFVGDDEAEALAMATEMLGGDAEVVRVQPTPSPGPYHPAPARVARGHGEAGDESGSVPVVKPTLHSAS